MAITMHNARRRGGFWTVATVSAGAALAGAAGLTIALAQPSGRSTPSAVRTSASEGDLAVAQMLSFDVTTTATGQLEAAKQIEIRNQLEQATTITELVKEGVAVKAGDVLVRLNSDSIQTQVDEEGLKVESARADLTVAENSYLIQINENDSTTKKAEVAVAVADLELKQWQQGEVKSKRQELALAVEKATRELDRLRDKYKEAVELEKRGFLSRDELKRDEVGYLEAEAALKTADLNRVVYEEYQLPKDEKVKKSDLEQAIAELERTKRRNESELASKDADRKNKREGLRIREQKLAKLREQLEMSVIKAPSDGLVVYDSSLNRDRGMGGQSQSTLDVGVQVFKNQRMMVLPDTSEMVAAVRVQESLAGRVRKGQTASVKIDALGPTPVPGTVESVGVIAESGGWRDPNLREYTVKIRLDPEFNDPRLKPSMRCEAQIFLDKVGNALTVPIQSVFSDGLVRYVLVPLNERKFDRKPVRVGRRSDRYAEIAVGLKEGERVLLRAPQPGEVSDQEWSRDELAAVGLVLGDDGRVTQRSGGMPGAGPSGAPGGGPGGRPRGPGGPPPAGAGVSGGVPAGAGPATAPTGR